MRDIIWSEYNDLFQHNETLLAHLYQECPILTADCGYKEGSARNDYGYGIGLGQWNIHIRFDDWMRERGFYYRPSNPTYTTMVRKEFIKDYPHLADWRGQTRAYLDEQQECLKDNSLHTCVRRWNYLAGEAYWRSVQANINKIRTLVN